MQISEEQKKTAQAEFTTVWNFYKKYYNPEDSQDYWQAVVDEAQQISDKLDRLGIALLLAVIEELKNKSNDSTK